METSGKEKNQPVEKNLKLIRSLTDRHLAGVYKNLLDCCSYMLRNSELFAEDVKAALELAKDDLEINLARHQSTIELEESGAYKKRSALIYELVCNVLNKMSTKNLEYFVTECREGKVAEALEAESVIS